MAAASTLEYGNKVWGEVGDGLLQVRPSSMTFFCTGFQLELVEVYTDVR